MAGLAAGWWTMMVDGVLPALSVSPGPAQGACPSHLVSTALPRACFSWTCSWMERVSFSDLYLNHTWWQHSDQVQFYWKHLHSVYFSLCSENRSIVKNRIAPGVFRAWMDKIFFRKLVYMHVPFITCDEVWNRSTFIALYPAVGLTLASQRQLLSSESLPSLKFFGFSDFFWGGENIFPSEIHIMI